MLGNKFFKYGLLSSQANVVLQMGYGALNRGHTGNAHVDFIAGTVLSAIAIYDLTKNVICDRANNSGPKTPTAYPSVRGSHFGISG